MTDERKPETPGLAEMSPKFIAEAEAAVEAAASTEKALSAMWQEWQRACEANDKAVEDEDKAKLAKEAITDHETPEYRAAAAEFEAAQERPGKTFAALMAVEDRIENMAARSVKGAAIKLQVAKYWIDIQYPDGASGEIKMPQKERLSLSVLADLERLAGEGAVTRTAVPVVARTPSDDADQFLFALIGNMEAIDEIAGNMVPDGRDGAFDRLNERSRHLNRQIMNTRAQSIQGLTWKLRQLVSTLELEEGVSKYEMDMARSALADACGLAGEGAATRRQTVTTAAAASSASDPVAQIGRDLATIWRQVWRNEEEVLSAKAHSQERARLEHLESHLADRREALEAMAAEIQASNLEGVMVQIMLAHAEADVMAASTEESNEAQMRTVSKLLYSALTALERLASVPREKLGGEAYLTRELDPHALVAGDETKSTA